MCDVCLLLQADKDEARSQHAAAVSELEALTQQLATAATAKGQAEAAAEELQATHDALTAQHTSLQAQVCMLGCSTTGLRVDACLRFGSPCIWICAHLCKCIRSCAQ
jgi:ferric-dicitrate binding protein FerR (iron transport regulator)